MPTSIHLAGTCEKSLAIGVVTRRGKAQEGQQPIFDLAGQDFVGGCVSHERPGHVG